MEINNIYGSKPMTELGMLQQELLTARTEIVKQKGIAKELFRVLGNMKLNAIRDKYPSVKVLHEKYGAGDYEWQVKSQFDRIEIKLCYCVKRIPLDGLSKSDKVIANKYRYAYGYDERQEIYYQFKSFKEKVLDYACWYFELSDIMDADFLKKGLTLVRDNNPFTIILNG